MGYGARAAPRGRRRYTDEHASPHGSRRVRGRTGGRARRTRRAGEGPPPRARRKRCHSRCRLRGRRGQGRGGANGRRHRGGGRGRRRPGRAALLALDTARLALGAAVDNTSPLRDEFAATARDAVDAARAAVDHGADGLCPVANILADGYEARAVAMLGGHAPRIPTREEEAAAGRGRASRTTPSTSTRRTRPRTRWRPGYASRRTGGPISPCRSSSLRTPDASPRRVSCSPPVSVRTGGSRGVRCSPDPSAGLSPSR